MSRFAVVRRGQPLLFLGALLSGWLGVRAVSWEPPFAMGGAVQGPVDEPGRSLDRTGLGSGIGGESTRVQPVLPGEAASSGVETRGVVVEAQSAWRALIAPLPGRVPPALRPVDRAPLEGRALWSDRRDRGATAGARSEAAGADEDAGGSQAGPAVSHALLAMMGLSRMQLPPALASLAAPARRPGDARAPRLAQTGPAVDPLAPARRATPVPGARRWSADGWLLLREGDLRSPVPGQPSYGRSQAGAVLRYRLAPSPRHAPEAYARASAALRSPRDAEIAAGLSARPLAGVPLRVAGELRLADRPGGVEIRPAAYAVTEIAPIDLPFATRAEFYAQGGYVGGDFATAFVDGQARVTRDVARVGRASFAAGAGAWGGAQKGAARLDVGPTASVTFAIGSVFARVTADYRVRVAGDAEPESGPALTLSAGF